MTKRGEVISSNSILHSQNGTAVYVNRYIGAAFFGPNEVRGEIDRLSAKFGERAREFRMPKRDGFPNAIIAIWGKIELRELSPAEVSTVASGGNHKGISLSYLGDLQRSAQAGMPVYELAGGAGFAWAASFNEDGRGVLRFLTIDASQMPSGTATPSAAPPPQPPQPPPPDAWKDCQSKDTDTRLSGCTKFIDANGTGSPSRLADALDGRCWAYIDKKQYDHAVTDCKAAIEKNPRYLYAFSHLGEALIGLKDYAGGIEALNKAIELKGNSIWARLNRAAAFEATGRAELALKDYEFALFIDPSNQRAREGVVKLSSRLEHGASPPCFEARNYWKNEVPRADATAAPRSVDILQETISSLEVDAAMLTQLAQQKSNEARGYKQEEEQRLDQLPATRQQSLLNEVQKFAVLYSDAQAHLDDLTKDVARQRTKVQETAEGTNTRTTQQRLRPLREQLHSLETARSEADRDAQQKLSQLKAVTENAERAAADFANTFAEVQNGFIQADSTAQCATEARNQAQLLLENAKELRVTLKQQRLAVERETAETLISDVSEFSKRNHALLPIEIASLVVALKAVVRSDDLEVISQARANLDIRLTEVKEFNGFRREVEAERQKQRRVEFETAVVQSHLMTDFVEEYVSRNLASDVVPSLLKLDADIAAALTLALASSTAERLKPVLAAKEKEFAVLGVSRQYEAFLSKRQELEPPNKPQSVEPTIFVEAIDFLNDTHRFVADRKLIDGISEVALQALNLRTAIDKGDEASTRSSVNHLKELLGPVPGFTKFRQQQEQKRGQERARRLAAVTFEAQKNIYFVDEYLRTHIGDKITEQLLKQKARLSAALTGQSSDAIGKANDMFQTYLKDNALLDKYQETAGKYGNPPPAAARPSPVETPNLADAREFLDDTQKFTADHKVDRISEIAQEALNLRLALDAFDEATAMQAKRHLSDLLDPVEGFREFRQVRDQDRDHERARRLAVTSAEAEKNLVFIEEYLRTHVGDKITEQLLKQRERLSASLDSRLIDEITVANDTFRAYLNDNVLRKEYEEVTKDYGKPPPSPAPKPGSPEEALGVSPKSRFAIAGPEHDIVLI